MGLIWDLEDKRLEESKYIKEIQSTPSEKWILASQEADQKANGLTAWEINIWHVEYQIKFTLSPTLPNLWKIKIKKKKKKNRLAMNYLSILR